MSSLLNPILKPTLKAILLMIIVGGYGCAWIDALGSMSESRFENLMAKHQYRELLISIQQQLDKLEGKPEEIQAEHRPQLEIWQQQANAASEKYLQEKSEEIASLMKADDWSAVGTQVDFLLQHIPESEALSALEADYREQRAQFVVGIERQISEIEAQYIPKTLPLYEQLLAADNDDDYYQRLWQREQNRRDSVLAALVRHSDEAMNREQFADALKYLRLAQGLQKTDTRQNRISQLREQISARQNLEKVPDADQRSQQMAEYSQSLERKDWLAARAQLERMLSDSPAEPMLLGLQDELREALGRVVADSKVQGEVYYSAGEIEQALNVWNSVLVLAPEDTQLLNNIERAQRILDKVKSLQSGSSDNTSAQGNFEPESVADGDLNESSPSPSAVPVTVPVNATVANESVVIGSSDKLSQDRTSQDAAAQKKPAAAQSAPVSAQSVSSPAEIDSQAIIPAPEPESDAD